MTESEDIRDATITRRATQSKRLGIRRAIRCPECDFALPVDEVTECSRCGAHLKLKIEVVVPGIHKE